MTEIFERLFHICCNETPFFCHDTHGIFCKDSIPKEMHQEIVPTHHQLCEKGKSLAIFTHCQNGSFSWNVQLPTFCFGRNCLFPLLLRTCAKWCCAMSKHVLGMFHFQAWPSKANASCSQNVFLEQHFLLFTTMHSSLFSFLKCLMSLFPKQSTWGEKELQMKMGNDENLCSVNVHICF